MQYFLVGDMAYYGPVGSTPGEMFIYEDSTHAGYDPLSSWIKLNDASQYYLRNSSIDLAASQLIQDQSYATSAMYAQRTGNAYIAQGYFEAGAILTITGDITNQAGTETLFSGTVLEAVVNANFYGRENNSPYPVHKPDYITFQLFFDVTGGELQDGAVTGFSMPDKFYIDVTLRDCFQYRSDDSVGAVNNFANDISYVGPSFIQINPIYPTPEPATLILLCAGGLIGLGKRRKQTKV
jgi:hypothetical protein